MKETSDFRCTSDDPLALACDACKSPTADTTVIEQEVIERIVEARRNIKYVPCS